MRKGIIGGIAILLLVSGCGMFTNDADLAKHLPGTWITPEDHKAPIEPFLAVDSSGVWLASDGCNQVQGTWNVDDGLKITAGPSTLIFCEGVDVPGIFAQAKEIEFTKEGWLVIDGTTTLRPSFGAPAMQTPAVYLRPWGPTESTEEPWITFKDDGTFHGFDGCNIVGGEFTHEYGVLDLTFGMSTRKACEGVDTWLSNSVAAYLFEGSLGFFGTDGSPVGSLSLQIP